MGGNDYGSIPEMGYKGSDISKDENYPKWHVEKLSRAVGGTGVWGIQEAGQKGGKYMSSEII